MKRFNPLLLYPLLLLVSVFLSDLASGQDKHLVNPDPQQMAFVDLNENKGTFFFSAQRLNTNLPNTEDGNLITELWLQGIVQFTNGKQYRTGLLKFDLAKNELYFKNNERPNLFADQVAGFLLVDSAAGVQRVMRFNNGYPAFGKQTEKSFYEVLAYGKNARLLKYFSKYVTENQAYGGISTFKYKLITDYFIYNTVTRQLSLVKKTTASIENALPQLESKIASLSASKKLNEGEMVDLINKLNNL